MVEEFGKFPAIGGGGRKFIIFVFNDNQECMAKEGLKNLGSGPYLETSEGYKVKKIERGQYWIERLDLLVMSDDPNAV